MEKYNFTMYVVNTDKGYISNSLIGIKYTKNIQLAAVWDILEYVEKYCNTIKEINPKIEVYKVFNNG